MRISDWSSDVCSSDLIDALPQLKAICSQGVGYDAIDVKHAQSKGIQVSNTPDVLNDCVADLAFGLLLATARKLGHAERYVRDHQWGTGEIGRASCRERVCQYV